MMNAIRLILILLFFLFWFFDLLGLSFLVSRNYSVDNKYYSFHQKYGVQRTSILKLIFGLLVIILMWGSPLNVEIIPIVVIYCVYIAWLLFKIGSIFPHTTKTYSTPRHPLDSLVGFLTYPFEYLETNKSILTDQTKKLRWSWGAFGLPEWWYFKNEILGAGYLSLLFLFIYIWLGLWF